MKKRILLILLIFFALQTFSQEKILIADRKVTVNKDGIRLLYSFEKGDKIIISMTVEKDKSVNDVKFEVNGNILFTSSDVSSFENKEFTMPETNFLNLNFWGPNVGSRDFDLLVERIPASTEGKYFNSAIQEYKKYDTTIVAYEIDSVVGYEEIRTPKEFKVIESSEYQSTPLKTEKFSIYGGKTKSVTILKPQEKIITEDSICELLGYRVMITSAAGAGAMWDAIGTGVDIACLAMNFLPAGGTLAGLGVKTAFEMFGPQEGGEPVYYVIMDDEKELAKFTDESTDTNPLAYESGLATGYSGSWFAMDTLIVGLKNLNIGVQVDVTVMVSAVYQVTKYVKLSQDIVTIKPKTVKVAKTREVITNSKFYNYQK